MAKLSPEEEQRILNGAPRGTMALLTLMAIGFTAAWLFLFLVRFLGHGPIH